VGDRKAAAGLVSTRLAEVLLQFKHVGHGETRSIWGEYAMPMPRAGIVDLRLQPLCNASNQFLGQRERQATAGLAVGRGGEDQSADPNQMIDGGIAVEDPGQEEVNQRDGVEETLAPGVIDLAAGVKDLRSVQLLGGGLLESSKDANHSEMHDVLPAKMVFLYHLYDRERCLVQLILGMRLVSIGLVSFRVRHHFPLFVSDTISPPDGSRTSVA
jgi:hypothetical protein